MHIGKLLQNKEKTSTIDNKGGHEPARAGLGSSQSLARSKTARLGLARFSPELEK
jgi:hypothetical protein